MPHRQTPTKVAAAKAIVIGRLLPGSDKIAHPVSTGLLVTAHGVGYTCVDCDIRTELLRSKGQHALGSMFTANTPTVTLVGKTRWFRHGRRPSRHGMNCLRLPTRRDRSGLLRFVHLCSLLNCGSFRAQHGHGLETTSGWGGVSNETVQRCTEMTVQCQRWKLSAIHH